MFYSEILTKMRYTRYNLFPIHFFPIYKFFMDIFSFFFSFVDTVYSVLTICWAKKDKVSETDMIPPLTELIVWSSSFQVQNNAPQGSIGQPIVIGRNY